MLNYIIIVEYRPEWKEMYKKEAALIKDILGEELQDIHHIGSTSVEGLAAKPVIDIMPVVKEIEKIDAYNGRFEALGYECMGEYGIPGRRFYRKGGDDRTHHIHIFGEANAYDIKRHMAVRDYLRCHKDAAKAYGEIKASQAKLHPGDIEGYCAGKDAFVKQLEQDAVSWYKA